MRTPFEFKTQNADFKVENGEIVIQFALQLLFCLHS